MIILAKLQKIKYVNLIVNKRRVSNTHLTNNYDKNKIQYKTNEILEHVL